MITLRVSRSAAVATTAIHALTVGAMGTMILAVMTRATLGHTRRELTADRGTVAAYAFVMIAAAARVIGPFLEADYLLALDVAGVAWVLAFALFVVLYRPLFGLEPVRDDRRIGARSTIAHKRQAP